MNNVRHVVLMARTAGGGTKANCLFVMVHRFSTNFGRFSMNFYLTDPKIALAAPATG